MRTRIWMYTIGAALIIVISLLLGTCGGDEDTPSTPSHAVRDSIAGNLHLDPACIKADSMEVTIQSTTGHPGRWIILGFLIIGVWSLVLYFRRTGGWQRAQGAPARGVPTRADSPPDWAWVTLVVLPVINGLLSVGFPKIWALFWSTPGSGLVAIGFIVALFTANATGVLKTSGTVTLWLALTVFLLTTGRSYLEYRYYKSECSEVSQRETVDDLTTIPAPEKDTVFVLTARTGQPVAVTVPEMWRWDLQDPAPAAQWDHDGKKVGHDRIETFWVESPDSVATLHVKVSRCLTIAQCAW